MKVRDSQKSKVYAWEKQALKPHYLVQDKKNIIKYKAWALEKSQIFISKLCRDYCIPYHTVIRTRSYRAFWNNNIIKIPLNVTTELLLHEAAHGVTVARYGRYNVANHGPEFMRIYLELLARYAGYNKYELLEAVRQAGIKLGQGRI